MPDAADTPCSESSPASLPPLPQTATMQSTVWPIGPWYLGPNGFFLDPAVLPYWHGAPALCGSHALRLPPYNSLDSSRMDMSDPQCQGSKHPSETSRYSARDIRDLAAQALYKLRKELHLDERANYAGKTRTEKKGTSPEIQQLLNQELRQHCNKLHTDLAAVAMDQNRHRQQCATNCARQALKLSTEYVAALEEALLPILGAELTGNADLQTKPEAQMDAPSSSSGCVSSRPYPDRIFGLQMGFMCDHNVITHVSAATANNTQKGSCISSDPD
eukprot:gnl/MRDRNA2_/MRDRNA2_83489_c0_seq1.p1 gnl/MRDRNA2_/MRDRNA2_83489_c0~~gnl/MRDRNA2_/MRDRNA2_83489_c0_seq1.p1  ORF type:complete len:301 (+),score=46.30 gnl/MRDRNA2_/MRDRNA2_83489_c0_seq1:82-903(+)